MSKWIGLFLAAWIGFVSPCYAQRGIDTQFLLHANPYPVQTGDQVICTRAGITYNCLFSPTNFPIATLSTNGISKPDGTTLTINANGTLSAIATPDQTNIGTVTTANPQISGAATSGFYSPGSSIIGIELNGAPAMRWNTLASGVDYITVTPGKVGTTAKLSLGGTTTNQGLDITATGTGALSLNGVAISSTQIITGGTWQGGIIQPSYLAVATSSATGIGRPDNSTISVTGGVWSTIGSGTAAIASTTSAVNYNLVFATTTTGNLPLYATTSVEVNASTKVLSSGAFNSTTSTTGYQLGGNTALFAPGGDTQSIGVGNAALGSQTSGTRANTAVGYNAGAAVTSAVSNVFVGSGTASSGTATGTGNVFVGKGVGPTLTSGSNNTYVGYLAGTINTVAGDNNTLIGANAIVALSTTTSGTAVGVNAKAGSKDVAIGPNALAGTTTNTNTNTALGYNSGKKITTGTRNLVLGPDVASTTLTIGSSNILIGTTSGLDTTTSSISNYFSINNGTNPIAWATSTDAVAPLHIPGGLFGTTTADSACTGCIGEYLSTTTTDGSQIALSTGTAANVVTLGLTAGDWDVGGNVAFNPNGATITSAVIGGISATTATLPGQPGYSLYYVPASGGATAYITVPTIRVSLAATTSYFLVGQALFGTSTNAAYGAIWARRRR